MEEYKAIYKCRLCGEAFGNQRAREEIAQAMTLALATVGNTRNLKCNGDLDKKTIHYCKDGSFGMADFQGFRKINEDRIQIYIEETKQETTAKLKLEGIAGTGISVAILYDIPIAIKPFPMFTKVRIRDEELEFYLGKDNTLIQKDCKPFDFWLGK